MTNTMQLTILMVLMLSFVSAYAIEHTVGIRGGATMPFFDIDDDAKTKLMGGISYEAWLKDYLSLGIAHIIPVWKPGIISSSTKQA